MDQKPFLCALCYEVFTGLDELNVHQQIEHQINQLIVASYSEPVKEELNEDVRSHSVEHLEPEIGSPEDIDQKPYLCNMCIQVFADLDSLVSHQEEEHFCHVDPLGFTQKGDLNQHLRIHSGVKPFDCEQCHKSFTKRYHLLRHLRVHSGEKPFKCDQCNKAYSGKHHLTHHLLTHSEEQPLSCDQCHKTFMCRIDLLRHLCIRPGEKMFECEAFKRGVNLFRHLKSHAGKRPESSEKRKWPMSRRKSRFKTVNERKKLYHCFRCRRCFKLKLHLTCHKIRNKYGMCKCKRRNKKFGFFPFLANTKITGKDSTLYLASRFRRQQKSKYLKQCFPSG